MGGEVVAFIAFVVILLILFVIMIISEPRELSSDFLENELDQMYLTGDTTSSAFDETVRQWAEKNGVRHDGRWEYLRKKEMLETDGHYWPAGGDIEALRVGGLEAYKAYHDVMGPSPLSEGKINDGR